VAQQEPLGVFNLHQGDAARQSDSSALEYDARETPGTKTRAEHFHLEAKMLVELLRGQEEVARKHPSALLDGTFQELACVTTTHHLLKSVSGATRLNAVEAEATRLDSTAEEPRVGVEPLKRNMQIGEVVVWSPLRTNLQVGVVVDQECFEQFPATCACRTPHR
jgi:hypothetical protein